MLLFNNGEEMGLLGSVEFATADPMFKNVSGFINLDCFPGTKSMLFRSLGGYLVDAYFVVPHPLGNILVQSLILFFVSLWLLIIAIGRGSLQT
jgi:hypothetical protein